MAQYKDYSYLQTKMVAIYYDRQIIPGTFEHTLSDVIDSLDISIFDERYHNDKTGAPAYDPRGIVKNYTVCLFQRFYLFTKNSTALQ